MASAFRVAVLENQNGLGNLVVSSLEAKGYGVRSCPTLADLTVLVDRNEVDVAIIVPSTPDSETSTANSAEVERLCPSVPALLADATSANGHRPRARADGAVGSEETLTPRQLQVDELVAEGLTNAEIAHRLVLTPGTVANHVAEILQRLQFHSRIEIATWAARRRLPASTER